MKNFTNSNAVNLELTAKVLANGLTKSAKKQNKFISKYKHGIIAICILAVIPCAVIIAKSFFGLEINLNDM